MAYDVLPLTDHYTVIDADLLNHFQTGIKNAHNMIEGFRIEYVGRTTDAQGRDVDQYKVIVPSGEEYSFSVTGGKDGAPGEKGDTGLPGNITLNGAELKFFVGTKAEFDTLPSQKNVFAIITDDPTQVGVVDAVTGFLNGTLPVPAAANDGNNENIAETYARKDEQKVYNHYIAGGADIENGTEIKLPYFPKGKTLNDVTGIGIRMGYSSVTSPEAGVNLDFSGGRIEAVMRNPTTGRYETPFHLSTSAMRDDTGVVTAAVNVALSKDDSGLYIRFDNGFYKKDDYLTVFTQSGFYVINICYWFA